MFTLIMLAVYAILAVVGLLVACFAIWLAVTLAYAAVTILFQTIIALAQATQWVVLLPVRLVLFVARKVTRKQ